MDAFEYYGFFNPKDTANRLNEVETRIIESLFDKYLPKSGRLLNTCSGDGKYAFKFAENGYSVTVADENESNVNILKNDTRASLLNDIVATTPSELSMFENDSFDVVISLGSVYHMQTKAEREVFVRESMRVLAPDGYLAFTYMTPIAMNFGQYFYAYKAIDANEKMKAFRRLAAVEKTHAFDKFYGMNLDEMADISREYGIDIQTVAATYSMVNDSSGEIAGFDDEAFEKFVEDQISICEDPFVTRYCMRGLFIGKKKLLDPFA